MGASKAMFNKVQTLVITCNSCYKKYLVVTMLDTLKCWVAVLFLVLLSEGENNFPLRSNWHGKVLGNFDYNPGSFIDAREMYGYI